MTPVLLLIADEPDPGRYWNEANMEFYALILYILIIYLHLFGLSAVRRVGPQHRRLQFTLTFCFLRALFAERFPPFDGLQIFLRPGLALPHILSRDLIRCYDFPRGKQRVSLFAQLLNRLSFSHLQANCMDPSWNPTARGCESL